MKILFAIPHFFSALSHGTPHASSRVPAESRKQALSACISSLHQLFGRPQCVIDHAQRTTTPANEIYAEGIKVVVCTSGDSHLLHHCDFPENYFQHVDVNCDPRHLGFACHRVIAESSDAFDYYGYLEDDLVIRDPDFFAKLSWFSSKFGNDSLLMPNRYEVAIRGVVHKAYVDGPMRPEATAEFQDVRVASTLSADYAGRRIAFYRPLNPHSGSFFLNREQRKHWVQSTEFGRPTDRFIGPLESAATLGVMSRFRVYKPVDPLANFLELEHSGTAYIDQICER